jgi:hypothetical protein
MCYKLGNLIVPKNPILDYHTDFVPLHSVARCVGSAVLGVSFLVWIERDELSLIVFRAGNNTNLSFNVILNPCSGPCLGSLPEPAYIEEIPKLKDYPNIRTLGYVATNYADKALDSVLAEIRQWESWPILMNDTRMAVDGIFFDEIPGLYQWQKHDYLKTATDTVQQSELLGDKLIGKSVLLYVA